MHCHLHVDHPQSPRIFESELFLSMKQPTESYRLAIPWSRRATRTQNSVLCKSTSLMMMLSILAKSRLKLLSPYTLFCIRPWNLVNHDQPETSPVSTEF